MCFLRDSILQIILNPGVIMRDPALLQASVVPLDNMDALGRNPSLISFNGTQIQVKNSNGARVRTMLPVYAQLLLERIQLKHLKEAVAICRLGIGFLRFSENQYFREINVFGESVFSENRYFRRISIFS